MTTQRAIAPECEPATAVRAPFGRPSTETPEKAVALVSDQASLTSDERFYDRVLNAVSDTDWSWWPFLRLRPAKDAELTWRTVVIVSLLGGILYGVPFGLLLFALHRIPPDGVAIMVGIVSAALFGSGCSVRGSWNRRATRLVRKQ
jgi:hypothetical protein